MERSRSPMAQNSPAERKIDAKLVCSVVACGFLAFAGVVVETAMNVTFPTLMAEFGIDISTVQWITTGYLLVMTIVMPLTPFLSRRIPTRTLFMIACVVFMAVTALAAVAPSFGVLLACRVIQGMGAGIAMPLMFNIVAEQAPFEKMGMMMGVATFVVACAPAIGPSFGGLIVTTVGWRGIFLCLLPLLVLSLVLGVANIRQAGRLDSTARFDLMGWMLLAAAIACLLVACSYMSVWGWTSARTLGLFAVSVVVLLLFVAHCGHTDEPLLWLSAFHAPAFSLGVAAMMLIQLIVLGFGLLIPNYAQIVGGQDAFVAGCLILPGCIVGAILAPVSGRIYDRLGAVVPLSVGAACMALSCVIYALAHAGMSNVGVELNYVLFAFGQGLCVGNLLTIGLTTLGDAKRSDGTAIANTLQQLSGALGTAIMSAIVAAGQAGMSLGDAGYVAGTAAGTHMAFVVSAVLGVVLFVDVVALLARKRG